MTYILGANGKKYELNPLTRKQKIQFVKILKEIKKEDFEQIDECTFQLLRFNYPEITREEFESILDYNAETYGFEETYEMLGYIIEDVFTQVGGNKVPNPYLEAKREQQKAKEEQAK